MRTSRALVWGVPWALAALEGGAIYLLIRQHGRTLLAQDELRERLEQQELAIQELKARLDAQRVADAPRAPAPSPTPTASPVPAGLPIGSPAPSFTLPDLNGVQRTLRDFLGRPLLVIFFNTGCGFCTQMAPKLGQLPDDGPRVLLISRGDANEHRRLAAEHHWGCDVVLETAWEVATAYAANGTPMGYLLDAEGRVASERAVGADGVLALLNATPASANGHHNGHANELTADALRAKELAAVEQARTVGLPVRESTLNRQGLAAGTKAPEFRLPDLQGKKHSLADYRGKQVMLVFSDPQCGPCQALVPELVALQKQLEGSNRQLLMISRGDLTENLAKAAEHHISFPVLLQKQWEISKEYGMFATPIAYLIDAKGIIERDVAVGGTSIMQLVEPALARDR